MSEQTQQDDGGPFFPSIQSEDSDGNPAPIATDMRTYIRSTGGVSLRDWLAGQALAGWLASYGPDCVHPAKSDVQHRVSEDAYAMADAMLKARNAKE